MHSDGASRPLQSPIDDAVQDIVFGSVAGMVSEVFEYPFDLAKVRLQSQLLSSSSSQPRFKGPMDCLMQTWRDEGFKGLYRGLPVPLLGSMLETAALFVAYSSLQNGIRRYYKSSDELTIPQLCFAAAGAGATTSFILTPIELVKCKIQVQMLNVPTPPRVPPIHVPVLPKPPPRDLTSSSIYTRQSPPQSIRTSLSPVTASSTNHHLPGPLTIVRNIIATNGVRGLWLGHTGTVLRETGGTAVWFSVKEWVGRILKERRTKTEHSSSPLLPWESAFAGAVSGAVCVAALYPADTVKSAMQTEEELREMRVYQQRASSAAREWSTSPPSTTLTPSSSTSSPPYSTSKQPLTASSALSSVLKRSSSASPESMSFLETFLKIYRTHGAKGLYSGCGMSMARAIPSSGIVFVVYDGLRAWFA